MIRAYGDSKDARGKIVARSWCEATVQRTPEWTEATNESPTRQRAGYPDSVGTPVIRQWEETPGFPQINRTMGRRFKIQSFRWLSAREV